MFARLTCSPWVSRRPAFSNSSCTALDSFFSSFSSMLMGCVPLELDRVNFEIRTLTRLFLSDDFPWASSLSGDMTKIKSEAKHPNFGFFNREGPTCYACDCPDCRLSRFSVYFFLSHKGWQEYLPFDGVLNPLGQFFFLCFFQISLFLVFFHYGWLVVFSPPFILFFIYRLLQVFTYRWNVPLKIYQVR